MAFIRWKLNRFGLRQAYLVQSYRDEEGRPKHKTLAYLGRAAELSPERIAILRQQYPELRIAWDKIQIPDHPEPLADLDQLADAELVSRLRRLRRERSINAREAVEMLTRAGLTRLTGPGSPHLTPRFYGVLEQAFAEGRSQPYYASFAAQLLPFLRKMLKRQL